MLLSVIEENVVIALVTAGGVVVTAFLSLWGVIYHAKVNDAVNHRHRYQNLFGKTGKPPKLYDLMLENHRLIHELIDCKKRLDEFIPLTQTAVQRLDDRIDLILEICQCKGPDDGETK